MTNQIRFCEHPHWPVWRDRGFESSANNLIHRKAFLPLDSEDTVFTPDTHHVYIFETIYNQRIIWYRWSNMVIVENEIYYVFSSDNLLESYAWSVHKKEDRAEHLLVKQTPLRYKRGRAGQLSIRGIRIDRDTGSFINTPYFASCARIKLPDYYELKPDYTTDGDQLTSAVRVLQRWARSRSNRTRKSSFMTQFEQHGYFALLPEDILLLIEAHLRFRPRQLQCEFTQIPIPNLESVFA